MSKSEYKIFNNNKKLIICFGGLALQIGGILPFEFLNYLSCTYTGCDLLFYIDKNQCWYHKGIQGITNNIDDTVLHLNNIIKDGNYEKVIFMGVSAGGYASILFGSLCDNVNNVNNVISFIPQTILNNPINSTYSNLKNIINKNTNYIIYGDTSIQDKNDYHHILHCKNIECFSNVKINKNNCFNMKKLRDNGSIKKIIDDLLDV
uniref:Alpha/beta hydrolase n=1 Tax=viral metagenome TaxID=1070528 RepID=A0A6C0HRX9_9ZZZZ